MGKIFDDDVEWKIGNDNFRLISGWITNLYAKHLRLYANSTKKQATIREMGN